MKLKRLSLKLLPLLLLDVVSPSASAFPIAASGTEGLLVIASGTDPITATYQGTSAAYTNLLYLMLDGAGNPGDDGNTDNDLFVFNNQTSPVGSTVNLGSFAAGTELMFRLHVNNTTFDYFTGPASRNPDGQAHARVQANWQPNESLVSFEDLNGGPFDYNDLSFSFTNASTSPIPLPATVWLFVSVLAGFVAFRRAP